MVMECGGVRLSGLSDFGFSMFWMYVILLFKFMNLMHLCKILCVRFASFLFLECMFEVG